MAVTIDSPPPLPSSVTSQMGGGGDSFSGIGKMLMNKSPMGGGDASGAASPTGAVKAQVDAIKKVLDQVIRGAGAGKTFFSRASQLLDQGLNAEASKGPGTPVNPQPDNSSEGPESMTPPAAFAG